LPAHDPVSAANGPPFAALKNGARTFLSAESATKLYDSLDRKPLALTGRKSPTTPLSTEAALSTATFGQPFKSFFAKATQNGIPQSPFASDGNKIQA
jgi:hypothetical protein